MIVSYYTRVASRPLTDWPTTRQTESATSLHPGSLSGRERSCGRPVSISTYNQFNPHLKPSLQCRRPSPRQNHPRAYLQQAQAETILPYIYPILQPILNASEVAQLFSHPLASFLSETPPYSEAELSDMIPYHTTIDYPWEGPGPGPASHLAMPPAPSTLSPDPHADVELADDSSRHKRKRKRMIRMHRFLTGREAGGTKPVFGLTA